MSKNDMVMVPRDWVESTIGAGPGEPVCRSDIDLLKTALASEQHQGEPVAWPARLDTAQMDGYQSPCDRGWNACLDEIAKLGPLYSHPMQGEPVGTLLIGEYFDNREIGEVDVQLDSKACDQLAEKYPGQSMQLYTHADPGEVERLRAALRTEVEAGDSWKREAESLRTQLAALRDKKLPHYLKLSDEMREAGERAEKRAIEDGCYSVPVLKAVFFEAAIQHWLDAQEESLSASAEPSAPADEDIYICTACTMGDGRPHSPKHCTLNKSALVECDERAAFESTRQPHELTIYEGEYEDDRIEWAWRGWKARAALGHKP